MEDEKWTKRMSSCPILWNFRGIKKGYGLFKGSNAEEGSKALLYFLPQYFPNRELQSPGLDRRSFEGVIDRIFADSSFMVSGKKVED